MMPLLGHLRTGKIIDTGNRSVMVFKGWGWQEEGTRKGHRRIVGGEGTILYIDCGAGLHDYTHLSKLKEIYTKTRPLGGSVS